MEILKEKRTSAKKTLIQLKKMSILLNKQTDPEIIEGLRGNLIHTFEYSFEAFWKYLKESLKQKNLIELEAPSPNKTFRTCLEQKIITQEEFDFLRDATEDRNASTHTYDEELVIEMIDRIEDYYNIMQKIIDRL